MKKKVFVKIYWIYSWKDIIFWDSFIHSKYIVYIEVVIDMQISILKNYANYCGKYAKWRYFNDYFGK